MINGLPVYLQILRIHLNKDLSEMKYWEKSREAPDIEDIEPWLLGHDKYLWSCSLSLHLLFLKVIRTYPDLCICQFLSRELTRPESWMLQLNHQGYAHLVRKSMLDPLAHAPHICRLIFFHHTFALYLLSSCHLLARAVACPPALLSSTLLLLLLPLRTVTHQASSWPSTNASPSVTLLSS